MPKRKTNLATASRTRSFKRMRAVLCLGCALALFSSPCLGQGEFQESTAAAQPASPPASLPSLSGKEKKRAENDSKQPVVWVPLAEAMQRTGDLSLRNSNIEGALFTIGETWGVNIVVGKEVQGKVSGDFKQAPLKEVLDSLLLANGYSYRPVGNSLVIQKTTDIGNALPMFQSITIPIVHGDIEEIAKAAELLVSARGKVTPLKSAQSILIVDFADRVKSVVQFIAHTEESAAKATGGLSADAQKRLIVAYFPTQYIPAENAQGPLTAVLSPVGRVSVMPQENRLVVVDFPPNIEMVRKVLAKIDRPRPQVRITALIYDISLQDIEQLGLNWNSSGKGNNLDVDGNPQQSVTLGTQTLSPFATGTAGGTLTVQSLTRNFDITTVGLFLQNANDARLLASPHVTVIDNETADMSSVQQIPFQQLTQSALGGQIGTTAFKDVGLKLLVTPKVAADGTVRMLISQEFSRLAGFTEQGSQPIIDTRTANTTVRVVNQQTFVISGLRLRSDTGDFNGIPFLKDVRLIGPLFRSRDTVVRESELVVFIRPEIIGYDDPGSPRQFMAQETVDCKLGQIPVAEGCSPMGGASCDPSGLANQSGGPIRLPPVEGQEFFEGADRTPDDGESFSQSLLMKQKMFRPTYQARFRATGGIDPHLQRQSESNLRQPTGVKKKASLWNRMFGS